MKILQLCNKTPYPLYDGGAIAMLNLSKSLAVEGHRVFILAMNTSKHPTSEKIIPDQLKSLIQFSFIPVDIKIRPIKLLLNFLFSTLPYNATRFESISFRVALSDLLRNERFDVIQLEGLYLKSYLPLIRQFHHGCIAYRAHNVENEIWFRLASQTQNPIKKYYLNNLARRIRKYEKDFIDQYDILLPITGQDLEVFRQMGNTKPAEVIMTGIPEEDFLKNTSKENSNTIFFIGALDWIPNQDGLTWFIENVWKRLRTHQPAPEFHVAGRNAPDRIARICRDNGIIFHGEVADAHQFMDDYAVMVVPLFAGSGLRIKIVEAMARSKVVITTTLGAQGIGVVDKFHALLADNENEFYTCITQMLTHNENSVEMKKNSYLFAREHFDTKKIMNKLVEIYTKSNVC